MITDILEYSIDGLKRRKLRSWLTIMGIVIGVLAIVLLISVALGLEGEIRNQLSFFSPDTLTITPGSMNSFTSAALATSGSLTEEDMKAVEKIGYAEYITPEIEGQLQLTFRNESATIYIAGVGANIVDSYPGAVEIGEGRMFKEGDSGVCVLGYKLAHGFFKTDITLNRRLTIGNKSFSVIGIMNDTGGILSAQSLVVYLPFSDARAVMPDYRDNKELSSILIKAKPGTDIDAFKNAIERELDNNHKVTKDNRDYTVITSDFIMQQLGAVFGLLTLFLGGMAGIALLVGSIGVANTMFMSVMERTREIGILKAIGADDSTIRNIFLVESGLIGLIGGTIGVILGVAASFAMNHFGVPSRVPLELVLGALAFSFIIGMLSGYVPARRAAELPAVEALRYE